MGKILKSREEKRIMELAEQKKKEEERRLEEENRVQEQKTRKQREDEEILRKLDEDINAGKKVIARIFGDWRGMEEKQLTMNHLIEKGYVCVQNDVSCTRSCAYYTLTFVKKEHIDFFVVR